MKRALGVCYYPEQWPEEIWARDAAQMVETGLSWVRIGEFAWSRLEPSPGDLRFDWLDRAIETLAAEGLKIVLGTPTATPPRWMITKHPDMLGVDREGRKRKFGSRRHYCFSHRLYREECARIVTLLAERYGTNPAIQAWQTDNEYGCHNTVLSYSNAARDAFRQWLAKRYGQIEQLNEAWGNVFWSMEYASFDEIELPNQTVTEPNPAHVMAFRRFASDEVVSFNHLQTEIICKSSDAPIIHNYMGLMTAFDHYATGADLDIASWDSYPLGFLSIRSDVGTDEKQRYLRQGDPDFQAFYHDLYRGVGRGRWWIMEQQPGPVNWAPYNPAPLPGMVRLWAWEAFAHGAEAVCYFRWRQAPFAQEQMHAGLLRPDSEPAPALEEAALLARELHQLPDVEQGRADVALIFDYESAWAWETQKQGANFSYLQLCLAFYSAYRKLGLNIDILPPDYPDLSAYKLVSVPALMNVGEVLEKAMETSSVCFLVGPRTNSKTSEFSIPTPLPPDLPGLEITVRHVESLPPDTLRPLARGGSLKLWFEHLDGAAETVEAMEDGAPFLVRAGNIHYMAGWPDAGALLRIIEDLCHQQAISTQHMPGGLRQRTAGNHRFLINYDKEPVVFEGAPIPAADVRWNSLNKE